AQIDESLLRGFSATLTAFSPTDAPLGSVALGGLTTAAGDGSAMFLGVLSDSPIGRIQIATTGPGGALAAGFLIGNLSLVEVPEPESLALLAGAIALAAGWRRARERGFF